MTLRLPLALFVLALSASAAGAQNTDALRKACGADALRLCPTVRPGDGRMAQCLIINAKQVSDGCLHAMAGIVATQIKQSGN
jgi:orotidine-5'-phosphate decarboxylase